MRRFIIISLLFLTGMEILSRVGIEPIEFYNTPMRKEYTGFAFYPLIFYKGSKDVVKYNLNGKSTRIHELTHHMQAEREGFLKYKLKYMYNQLSVGYSHNHYEIEAYAAERVKPLPKRRHNK